MGDPSLRARVIRLAHARPEMRSHLLPLVGMHKEAWIPLPTDGFSFGYEGEGSDATGRHLALEVREAVRQAQVQAKESWKDLAGRIIAIAPYDMQPELSREVVSMALRMTYRTLAENVESYFQSLPVK